MQNTIQEFWAGYLNSYSQIFFSDSKIFAAILIPVTFFDVYAGLSGAFSVLVTLLAALFIGLDPVKIRRGYYGFNSLLVGLGLGIYYEPGIVLVVLLVLAAVFTLFISVTLEGVIGKYHLPHLSLPFVFALWLLMLSSREFYALSVNERGIYTLNDLYLLGGHSLVSLYEWWNNLAMPTAIRSYFLSLGAILFQFSVLSGMLVSIGLLLYSRIAFTLSLIGFFAAWGFYSLIGAELTAVGYSYVGFNYILTAIALGGFFIIPRLASYLWVVLIVPMVAIVAISLSSLLGMFHLPVYALPFNLVVLVFLYVLKFRVSNPARLHTFFIQRNSPERNLYSFLNYRDRFGGHSEVPIRAPFFGEWKVTQGHDGVYTHKNDWKHAWDFEMVDDKGRTYRNNGDYPQDYYCFDKSVLAPADGVVEEVVDDVEDNIIGKRNLAQNWGNTVIIKHGDAFYSKLSHLKKASATVRRGDRVRQGDVVGVCGNSGNSPYPHLHFQVQSTPYIGSKTKQHPLSEYYERINGTRRIVEVGIPALGAKISNMQPNAMLKQAFELVPGKSFSFEVIGMPQKTARWEVRVDNALNRYIECLDTGSKAYFEAGAVMVHFVHFEGDRRSLLYQYYQAAYKISFALESKQQLADTFPIHLIFPPGRTVIQDFIAPFYRFLEGTYVLEYPVFNARIPPQKLILKARIARKVFGHETYAKTAQIGLDRSGLREFVVKDGSNEIRAVCVQN